MSVETNMTIEFPIGGLDCRNEYVLQSRERRSFKLDNVWPVNCNGQYAGGSRPVLVTESGNASVADAVAICAVPAENGSVGIASVSSSGTIAYDGDIKQANCSVGEESIEIAGETVSFKASSSATVKTILPSGNELLIIDDGGLSQYSISSGAVNSICDLPCEPVCACMYQGRLVVSDGVIVYFSKVGTYANWDFSAGFEDMARATAISLTDAGLAADNIVTMFSWNSGNALVIGCVNSLWVVTGNPTSGGKLECVSWDYGILSNSAWTLLPDASVMFLSNLGLCTWAVGGKLKNISVDRIAYSLSGFGYSESHVVEYDGLTNGVYVIPDDDGPVYWLSMTDGSIWKYTLFESRPVYSIKRDGKAVFLLKDGTICNFIHSKVDEIDSSIVIGPLPITSNGNSSAKLTELWGEMRGDVTWYLAVGDTAHQAVSNYENSVFLSSGMWNEDLQKIRPNTKGQYIIIALESSVYWEYGSITAVIRNTRRRR